MRKTLNILIIGVTLFCLHFPLGTCMAAPVSEATARQVALNFWNTYRPKEAAPLTDMQRMDIDGLYNMRIFVAGSVGFVIVASDDCVRPILGYSFDTPFPESLHPELNYWLNGYEEQITLAKNARQGTDPRWSSLLHGSVPPAPLTLQNVAPLCQTQWNQDSPYNKLCPWDGNENERTVVGCVATAMAQIMKRWNHPSCGTGTHSYVHESYGTLSADFEHTTYMWQDMPNIIHVATTAQGEAALSTLSYHCGVAVDMMYGTSSVGGSGAYSTCGTWASACADRAFYSYFKYDSSLYYSARYNHDDSTWLAMVDADMAEGRPIYYAGYDQSGGHAFVLDGSNLDTCYHFNWGWGGYGDGYYALNNLAPGSGGAGGNATYSFNYGQEAIFGIQPLPELFDTIEVFDTICSNYTEYTFFEYTLNPTTQTTYLRHLDTVFHLHLLVLQSNFASFNANKTNFGGETIDTEYCSADGIVMPECTFTRNNHRFVGWSRTKSDASSAVYQPGERVYVSGNITFYARWEDTTVGIPVLETEVVSLWPNPTTGELNVSLGIGHDAQAFVIDALGRTLLRENILNGTAKIDLSDLPAGSYTLQVKGSMGVFNRRIIKQ